MRSSEKLCQAPTSQPGAEPDVREEKKEHLEWGLNTISLCKVFACYFIKSPLPTTGALAENCFPTALFFFFWKARGETCFSVLFFFFFW